MKQTEYRDLSAIGFPGYRVGSDGSVWTAWKLCKRGKGMGRGSASHISETWTKLKPILLNKYYSVYLRTSANVRGKHCRIHHLVLKAFVGQCPQGMQACHFPDRNPANNYLANLRWDTKAANQADRIKHGTDIRGEKHFATRLTDGDVRQMRLDHSSGKLCRELGLQYGLHYATVAKIVKRKSWSHVI